MRTRTLLLGSALLALLGGAYACSDSDGGDVCEQAFNKTKSCVASLDCTSLTGTEKTNCEFAKSLYGALPDYATSLQACKQSGSTKCECTGETKADAEKVMTDMDPKTCTVEDTKTDGGGADQKVSDQKAADQQAGSH